MTADLNRVQTWKPYKKGLCDDCMAMCCRLPVELTTSDLLRMELIGEFEMELGQRWIFQDLKKKGIVKSHNMKQEKFLLEQRPNGDCLFLNDQRRCSIYDKRPKTCREHPQVGPRPNFCPYTPQDKFKK